MYPNRDTCTSGRPLAPHSPADRSLRPAGEEGLQHRDLRHVPEEHRSAKRPPLAQGLGEEEGTVEDGGGWWRTVEDCKCGMMNAECGIPGGEVEHPLESDSSIPRSVFAACRPGGGGWKKRGVTVRRAGAPAPGAARRAERGAEGAEAQPTRAFAPSVVNALRLPVPPHPHHRLAVRGHRFSCDAASQRTMPLATPR